MRINIKRLLVHALLIVAYLVGIGPLSQVYAGEAKNTMANCPASDPYVRVRTEIRNIESIRQGEREIAFLIHAQIRITNVSYDPVFVLSGLGSEKYPYPNYGAVSLARTEVQASSCRYLYDHGTYPSLDNSPYWKDLRKALDHETPPADAIRRIEPWQHWEFAKDIIVGITKYIGQSQAETAFDEIRSDPHVWLQVELLMWPSNLENYNINIGDLLTWSVADLNNNKFNRVFGKSLQKRWHTGHLIIENLITEPVELTLPIADPVVIAQKNKDEGYAFLNTNKAKDGVMIIPSSGGVQYKVLTQGHGPKPTEMDSVVVNYISKTIDGKELENKSDQKVKMLLSKIKVPGLKTALLQMQVGSKWEIVVPPEQAYGGKGYGPLEPNAVVIFDIELVGVQKE